MILLVPQKFCHNLPSSTPTLVKEKTVNVIWVACNFVSVAGKLRSYAIFNVNHTAHNLFLPAVRTADLVLPTPINQQVSVDCELRAAGERPGVSSQLFLSDDSSLF